LGCPTREARGPAPVFTFHQGRMVNVCTLGGVCKASCPVFYCCICKQEHPLFGTNLGSALLAQIPDLTLTERIFKVGGTFFDEELLISAYTRFVLGESVESIARLAPKPSTARTWNRVLLTLADVIGLPGMKPRIHLRPFDSAALEAAADKNSAVIRLDWTYKVGIVRFWDRHDAKSGYDCRFRCALGVVIGIDCNFTRNTQTFSMRGLFPCLPPTLSWHSRAPG
jgi:hypothetical protein